ncbi:uncharacterized protein [Embiotoca jacksoni]|uniref:uncharacterized protein isoform X3 n=1 Tax=Embiotoca jacksoni TaxID=100190 RepID=UPI003704247C
MNSEDCNNDKGRSINSRWRSIMVSYRTSKLRGAEDLHQRDPRDTVTPRTRRGRHRAKISEDPRGTVPELPLTDWVLLRVIKRKWSEPRWTGPFLVTERTSHAVRLEGKGDTWYHLLQCAPGLEPQRTLQETAADVVKNASKE